MGKDYNYIEQNSYGHQCCPERPRRPLRGLESFATIWRPYDATDPQLLDSGERVIFTEEEIIGDSITHVINSTDIGLEEGGSYLVQYTATVTSAVDAGTSRRIVLSLVFEDDTIVPGSTQATTVEPTRELNVVSASVIINTTTEDRVIRLVAEAIPVGIIGIVAATITVVKIR